MKQPLAVLNARIKLRKRHLWEWNTLITNHRKVLELIRDENASKFTDSREDALALVVLRNGQTQRLVKLMTHQADARQQLKMRHHQELVLFEQLSQTPE